MKRAVIFDMYETLITHYQSPLYFGAQMAEDAGIPEDAFLRLWRATNHARTVGEVTLEEALRGILREHGRDSEELVQKIAAKRLSTKEDCFRHLHPEILPMLTKIKEKSLRIGLISNCYSEEEKAIRKSVLLPYFDAPCLSCEQGIAKPDKRIYQRCMKALSVSAEECVYVGDGDTEELETAKALGMTAVQAVWYFKEGISQRKREFPKAQSPLEVLNYLEA